MENKIYKVIEDGIEYEVNQTYGMKTWHLNCKVHRENGPTIEYSNGYKCWCKNGSYHRTNGPAVIRSDGTSVYYLYGVCYLNIISDEEWLLFQIIT